MASQEALHAYKRGDYQKAKMIWEEASQTSNDDQAMVNLGLIYLKGEGVAKDFDKARAYFESASRQYNSSAFYNLALMYQSSIGVKEDMSKAIEFLTLASKSGHINASFRLGLLLLHDRSNHEKLKAGFEAMLKAALGGHAMAKMQMGGIDKIANTQAVPNSDFRQKAYEEQKAIIEDALTRYVRPVLKNDGGDILMVSYSCDPKIEIRLVYQGSCAGCSLGATTTYTLIYDMLTKVIDENISVYVI